MNSRPLRAPDLQRQRGFTTKCSAASTTPNMFFLVRNVRTHDCVTRLMRKQHPHKKLKIGVSDVFPSVHGDLQQLILLVTKTITADFAMSPETDVSSWRKLFLPLAPPASGASKTRKRRFKMLQLAIKCIEKDFSAACALQPQRDNQKHTSPHTPRGTCSKCVTQTRLQNLKCEHKAVQEMGTNTLSQRCLLSFCLPDQQQTTEDEGP